MVIIDDGFLEEVGLSDVDKEEKNRMIADITKALENGIGIRVEKTLGEEKYQELGQLIKNGENPAEWLKANIPNYQQIIDEEIRLIKEEIKPQVAGIRDELGLAPL